MPRWQARPLPALGIDGMGKAPGASDPVERFQAGKVAGDLPSLASLEPGPLPALLTRWSGSTVPRWQARPLPALGIDTTGKALTC